MVRFSDSYQARNNILYTPVELYFSKICSAYDYLVNWLFVYHHSCTSEVYIFLNRFSIFGDSFKSFHELFLILVTFQKVLCTFMVFVIILQVRSHEQIKRVNFTLFRVKSTLIGVNQYFNPLFIIDYPWKYNYNFQKVLSVPSAKFGKNGDWIKNDNSSKIFFF
jgi:hypothetical protein